MLGILLLPARHNRRGGAPAQSVRHRTTNKGIILFPTLTTRGDTAIRLQSLALCTSIFRQDVMSEGVQQGDRIVHRVDFVGSDLDVPLHCLLYSAWTVSNHRIVKVGRVEHSRKKSALN